MYITFNVFGKIKHIKLHILSYTNQIFFRLDCFKILRHDLLHQRIYLTYNFFCVIITLIFFSKLCYLLADLLVDTILEYRQNNLVNRQYQTFPKDKILKFFIYSKNKVIFTIVSYNIILSLDTK